METMLNDEKNAIKNLNELGTKSSSWLTKDNIYL